MTAPPGDRREGARETACAVEDRLVSLWPNIVMEGWHDEGAVDAIEPLIASALSRARREGAAEALDLAAAELPEGWIASWIPRWLRSRAAALRSALAAGQEETA